MDLSFGVSAYGRTRGNIAEMPVINMIAEAAPSECRIVLQSRPGLSISREVSGCDWKNWDTTNSKKVSNYR